MNGMNGLSGTNGSNEGAPMLAGAHVLVVDDDEGILRLARK